MRTPEILTTSPSSKMGRLSQIARQQFGLVTYQQAIDAGVSPAWLTRQCGFGLLVRRAPRVYALAGAPVSQEQSLMVHVLAAGTGSLATADSALGLWSPELVLPPVPEIVVPRSCQYRADGVVVHRSRDIDQAIPGVRNGIPVVGVARALLDASVGRRPTDVVERIDSCRRHLHLSVGALVDALERHRRRGRPGITTFQAAVQSLNSTIPDSEFERYVVNDLARHGLPKPRLHHVVRVAGTDPIELDIDWPGVMVDVELDGRDHTARSLTARRDRRRDRILQAAGYEVLRYTWADYVADRQEMLEEIAWFFERDTNRAV